MLEVLHDSLDIQGSSAERGGVYVMHNENNKFIFSRQRRPFLATCDLARQEDSAHISKLCVNGQDVKPNSTKAQDRRAKAS